MGSLPVLPASKKLSSTVFRLLGQNPGPFTLQGTNTYLIGSSAPYILIDTGEGISSYADLLRKRMEEIEVEQHNVVPWVSDIILTHWHKDHTLGLPSILPILKEFADRSDQPPPCIYKFPLSAHQALEHHDNVIEDSIPTGLVTLNDSGGKVWDLEDEQLLTTPTAALKVVHTPGHTPDSISVIQIPIPSHSIPTSPTYSPTAKLIKIFTADTILGHTTPVFTDLKSYMESLEKLASICCTEEGGDVELYPGHGEVIEKGKEKVEEVLEHRLQREREILAALEENITGPAGKSIPQIVDVVYPDVQDEMVKLAAGRGVGLYLEKLFKEGKVSRTEASLWKLSP